MKIELEVEETREVFLAVLDRIAEEAGLGAEDAAALRKWRTSMTPGSSLWKATRQYQPLAPRYMRRPPASSHCFMASHMGVE